LYLFGSLTQLFMVLWNFYLILGRKINSILGSIFYERLFECSRYF